jgi:transcriptional regulator with XRE-family HTH domain
VTSTPPVRRRLVGGTLRWYREHLGYTLDDTARILDCDRSKISRIETGQRGIRRNELRDLLAEYGIGEKQQVILTDMANPRRAQGWYTTYTDLLPGAYQDYLILETWASRISAYEAQRIPALLQTPAYARALAEADPGLADNDARDRAAGAALARQKAILGDRRPDVHVVIGEAALRQEVGGPAVMRGQLEMLARISGGSAVGAVQILPFTRGAHPAADVGSLAILQFSAAPRLGVAYLGGAGGGVLLEGQADLAAYDRMFEQLRAFALSSAQSALLLRELTAR